MSRPGDLKFQDACPALWCAGAAPACGVPEGAETFLTKKLMAGWVCGTLEVGIGQCGWLLTCSVICCCLVQGGKGRGSVLASTAGGSSGWREGMWARSCSPPRCRARQSGSIRSGGFVCKRCLVVACIAQVYPTSGKCPARDRNIASLLRG